MKSLCFAFILALTVMVSTELSADWISLDHNGTSIRELARLELEMNEKFGVQGYFSALTKHKQLSRAIESIQTGRKHGITDPISGRPIAEIIADEKAELEDYLNFLYPSWRQASIEG